MTVRLEESAHRRQRRRGRVASMYLDRDCLRMEPVRATRGGGSGSRTSDIPELLSGVVRAVALGPVRVRGAGR